MSAYRCPMSMLPMGLQDLFSPYCSLLFIRHDDVSQVKKSKLKLLLNLLTVDNFQAILRELIVSSTLLHSLLLTI
jgi:hypothetical protein